MYENFKNSGDLEQAFKEAADLYATSLRDMLPILINSVTEVSLDKIYMQLINTEYNTELLNDAPHREVNDTSVIYRIMVSADERSIASAIITNHIAEQLGMSEEELFKVASENTLKLFPPVVKPITQVIFDILTNDGMSKELAEETINKLCGWDMPMWIISNRQGSLGAVNMLFEKNLSELSKKLDDDLYILPSSIHEVMAVPASQFTPEKLVETLNQVNGEVIDVSVRLSNQVYYYDRAERKLTIATDSPNRSIANDVAEVGLVYNAEQKR
jgi:hypothetical protein